MAAASTPAILMSHGASPHRLKVTPAPLRY
ncbi:unnamed protein product [Staurois parvus]|uniref:Uncharacterized protein n=1 Tax=Staurois parvus TaxID=386267 RepID=A0ABN9HPW3_9NEOB|nr:unnamed protein product [Staurois parvus]